MYHSHNNQIHFVMIVALPMASIVLESQVTIDSAVHETLAEKQEHTQNLLP